VETAHQAWVECDFETAFPLLTSLINKAERNDAFDPQTVPGIRSEFLADCATQSRRYTWQITGVSRIERITRDAGRFTTETAVVSCTHLRPGKHQDPEEHKMMRMTQRMIDLYGVPTPVGAWVIMNY
jgi:hypothetical protein